MTLQNSPHFVGSFYKVYVVVVYPDPRCSRHWEQSLNESITLDKFDQFCTGRRAGSRLWRLLALSISLAHIISPYCRCWLTRSVGSMCFLVWWLEHLGQRVGWGVVSLIARCESLWSSARILDLEMQGCDFMPWLALMGTKSVEYVPTHHAVIWFYLLFFCLYSTICSTPRVYRVYVQILPYLVIHIIHLCTLKIIISEFDFFFNNIRT